MKESPSEIRNKQSAAGRAAREAYVKLKHEVLQHEEENYQKIYVIKTKDGWFKMFAHSAVIYTGILAPRLGKKARLLPDTDYHDYCDQGVAMVKNLGELEVSLAMLGVVKEYDDKGVVVFRLKNRVEPEILEQYLRAEDVETKKIQRMLLPEVVFPALKQQLTGLARTTYHAVRDMTADAREMYGKRLTRTALVLLEDFWAVALGVKDVEEFFGQADSSLQFLKAEVGVVNGIGLMKSKRVYAVLEAVSKAQRELVECSRKYAEEKKAKELKAEPTKKRKAKTSETKEKVVEKAKNVKKK